MNVSSSPVRIGLIGIGGRLTGVVRRLLATAPEGRIEVAAVYDPRPGSLADVGGRYGAGCRIYDTEEALIADPSLEWVFIGSWNVHHARQAIRALEAGKHVFCEKPLAINTEDALAIQAAAERSGKTFAFGLVLRYSRHYQRIVDLLQSGAIGDLISFEFNETLAFNHGGYIFGNWRRKRANAGTHLLEKCCHDVDLANWIVNSLPVKVASFGGTDFFKPENADAVERIGPNPETGSAAYSSWPDPDRVSPFSEGADIFDNQVAILRYANGVRGAFHTNCHSAIPERRFYLCGTKGTIRADLYESTIEVSRIGWEKVVETIDSRAEDGHGGGDAIMAQRLVDAVLNGAAPLASVREGLYSALAVFGLDEAADNECVVNLLPLWEKAGIDPAGVRLRD